MANQHIHSIITCQVAAIVIFVLGTIVCACYACNAAGRSVAVTSLVCADSMQAGVFALPTCLRAACQEVLLR